MPWLNSTLGNVHRDVRRFLMIFNPLPPPPLKVDIINGRSLSRNYPRCICGFIALLAKKILNGIYCACATCPRRQRPCLRNVLYMMRGITSKKFTLVSFFLTFRFKIIIREGGSQNLWLINGRFLTLANWSSDGHFEVLDGSNYLPWFKSYS